MKSKKYLLIAFSILVAIQLWVPVQMIWHKEKVLKNGATIKFRTAPVDPVDAFRGRYIDLNFDNELTRYKIVQKWKSGSPVLVYLRPDQQGFAHIDTVSQEKIPDKNLYIKAKMHYINYDKGIVEIEYPFNRFYMEEHKAPKAEQVYREQSRKEPLSTYAVLKILDGDAVIKDVIIGSNSVLDLP